jgi:hypothetical protein
MTNRTSDQQKKFIAVRAGAKEYADPRYKKRPSEKIGRKVRVMMYLRINAMNAEGEYIF